MKKNYVRCPYCKKKTLYEQHICSNCKRLLPSEFKDEKSIPKFLVFIILIILVFTYYHFTKNDNNIDEGNVKNFSEVVQSINYDIHYNEDKLLFIKINNKIKVINTKGEVLLEDVSSLEEDCDYFYIITRRENNVKYYYLIDNKGKVLYKDKNKIYYYPKHNNFLVGKDLYYNNQKVASDIVLNNNKVYSGDYFSYNNSQTGGIIDYKGEIKYQTYMKEFLFLESTSKRDMLRMNYCIINKDYQYGVIDCESGEIIIDYNTREIEELGNNIYKMNGLVFYIDSNKHFIFYDKEPNEIDYTYKYFNNNKLLLGMKLLKTNGGISEDNLVTSSKIEEDNNIKTVLCKDVNIYYGMTTNDGELLPCMYDNIEFFNNKIYEYIDDKVYIILKKNNNLSLYDLKNDKYINNIEGISYTSPLIVYKDNNDRYVYNLKTNNIKKINEDDKITIYDNYYVIENIDVSNMISHDDYYGLNLKKIEIK